MPQTRALTFTSPSATPENQGRHGPRGREGNSVKQSEKNATGGLLRHTEPPSREAFLFDRIRFKASGRKRVKSPPDSRLHAFGDQAHPSQLILFSNKTGPFDNRLSGHASLPDCFSSHRLATGKRWGDFIPQAPGPGTGAGRAQWAQKSGGTSGIARSDTCGATMRVSVPRPLLRLALIAHFELRIV